MTTIFADASAYIALSAEDDMYHQRACEFIGDLEPHTRFLTSNFVLNEVITHINRRKGGTLARSFAEKILNSQNTTIVHIDLSLFREALNLLEKYRDKPLSFTDLISFFVMHLRHIRQAFTFDSDFLKVGFQVVP